MHLRLPLEHLSCKLKLLNSLNDNLLDLSSVQSLLDLFDIFSRLDNVQAVGGQGRGSLTVDSMGGDLFQSLEGIVVDADELRTGVGVDGETVDASGLWMQREGRE